MRRTWLGLNALGGLVAAALLTVAVVLDHDTTVARAEARLGSVARMTAVHADATIREAARVAAATRTMVAAWDPTDHAAGFEHFRALRQLLADSPYISSAWYLDAGGNNVLDSWTFPPAPSSAAQRLYFQRHLQGAPDPVIGPQETGSVIRRPRFTYSHSVRGPGGDLQGVIVVGIFAAPLVAVYDAMADGPGAAVGLFIRGDAALAQNASPDGLSPLFLAALETQQGDREAGLDAIDDGGIRRLVAWQRSSEFPDVYTLAAVPIGHVLSKWWWRAALMASAATLAVAGFALLTLTQFRAAAARQRAVLNEMAVREVHHRVKNALALMISMVRLRARRHCDPAVTAAAEDVAERLSTLVEIEDLLQGSEALDNIDLRKLLARLSRRLQRNYDGTLRFADGPPVFVDAVRGTAAATVVNELIVNALKHARKAVEVRLDQDSAGVHITVADDGPGLPANFDIEGGQGFGLRAAAMVAKSADGKLTAGSGGRAGGSFRLDLPTPAALRSATRRSVWSRLGLLHVKPA